MDIRSFRLEQCHLFAIPEEVIYSPFAESYPTDVASEECQCCIHFLHCIEKRSTCIEEMLRAQRFKSGHSVWGVKWTLDRDKSVTFTIPCLGFNAKTFGSLFLMLLFVFIGIMLVLGGIEIAQLTDKYSPLDAIPFLLGAAVCGWLLRFPYRWLRQVETVVVTKSKITAAKNGNPQVELDIESGNVAAVVRSKVVRTGSYTASTGSTASSTTYYYLSMVKKQGNELLSLSGNQGSALHIFTSKRMALFVRAAINCWLNET